MKANYYVLLLINIIGFGFCLNAQTTIYENDFNSGTASGWTLNALGSGQNQWIVNAEYAGFPPFILDTPNQPGVIAGSPNSPYLHIYNVDVCGAGICNAAFDTGSTSNQSAESPSIVTTGFTGVSASFYYLCAGASGTSFGVVEFSTNGGASWTQSGAQLSGVTSWTLATISDAALSGAANLKIRFRWVNGAAGNDPAFSIDDFEVVGSSGVVNSISTQNVTSPTSWCETVSQTLTVNFNAVGTYNAGNLFNVERSDATGSFASPVMVGTLNSSASGAQSVNAFMGSIPAGAGYLLRVVSTNPVVVGSATTAQLIVHPLPIVSLTPYNFVCVNSAPIALTGGLPLGGAYSGPGVTAGVLNPATAGVGTHTIIYSYVDGNDCSNLATQPILVASCADINETALNNFIQVFPVPTTNLLTIETEFQLKSVEVLDLRGSLVAAFKTGLTSISIQNLSGGTYFLKIETDQGTVIKQIVKR